jgi:hypothetical protein
MNETEPTISQFPFKFPPVCRGKKSKRRSLSKLQVPDQPEIEHLLLRSLAEHLKIAKGEFMWFELALRLARELMPEPMLQGAPLKWTANLSIGLIGEVHRNMVPCDKSKKISYACKQLSAQQPWATLIESESNQDRAETMRKRYHALKRDKDFYALAN